MSPQNSDLIKIDCPGCGAKMLGGREFLVGPHECPKCHQTLTFVASKDQVLPPVDNSAASAFSAYNRTPEMAMADNPLREAAGRIRLWLLIFAWAGLLGNLVFGAVFGVSFTGSGFGFLIGVALGAFFGIPAVCLTQAIGDWICRFSERPNKN